MNPACSLQDADSAVSDADFGAHDAGSAVSPSDIAASHADFGTSDGDSAVSVAEFAASDADTPIWGLAGYRPAGSITSAKISVSPSCLRMKRVNDECDSLS